MKLTNYLRNAFVSAVMQDVPFESFDEQIDKACVLAVAKDAATTGIAYFKTEEDAKRFQKSWRLLHGKNEETGL